MGSANRSELEMLRETAASFAANELLRDREETDRFPFAPFWRDKVEKGWRMGLFTLTLPEELGGGGQGVEALAVVLDALGQVDAGMGGIVLANALAQEICLQAGAGGIFAGSIEDESALETLTACPAFDDPRFLRPSLRADKRGGRWELRGRSEYVTLAGLAARMVLPALTGEPAGLSYFACPRGETVDVSEPVISLGLRACPSCDLEIKGAEALLLGEEGGGEAYFGAAYQRMLPAAAALSAGVLKGSLREALEYARQRRQGGREIVGWSEVRMILADMAVSAQEAELLVREACRAVDEGEPGWTLTARAASIRVLDLACEAAADGIQLLGGNGYMADYHQEKRFRDAVQVQSFLGMQDMKRQEYAGLLVRDGLPW